MDRPEQRAPESMARHLPGVLAYLVHVDSLLAMGGLALVLACLEWIGDLPGPGMALAYLAARLTWGGYFYLTARKASRGKLRLPVLSDFLDLRESLLRPLVQVGLATLGYWLVLVLVVQATIGIEAFVVGFRNRSLDFLWREGSLGQALVGLGLFYLPVALVAALASRRHVLPLLDPSRGFRLLFRHGRLPRCYAFTFTMIGLLHVIGVALDVLGSQIVAALPIPLAAPVIRYLMRLWVPLAQARLLGGFVHHNWHHLSTES